MTRSDLIAVVLFGGVLPVAIATGVGLATLHARRRARDLIAALGRYAKERSIAVRSSEQRAADVTFKAGGTLNEVRFELSVSSSRGRRAGSGGTRFRCRPKRAYAETVLASRVAPPPSLAPGMVEMRTGDGAFDAAYATFTSDTEDVMTWLGPKQRAYFVTQKSPWVLRASPTEVTISSPEAVVAPDELDRAAWVMTSIGKLTSMARSPMVDATTRVCTGCGMVFLAGERRCPNCGSAAAGGA